MERIAWRSSLKSECGVLCEKGAVKKKLAFSSTTNAGRKRAFLLPLQEKRGHIMPKKASEIIELADSSSYFEAKQLGLAFRYSIFFSIMAL